MRVTAKQVRKAQQNEYGYHVTFLNNLSSIQQNGLQAGGGQNFSGYTGYAGGKLFITDEAGVFSWNSKIEALCDANSDNPIEDGYVPITLRFMLTDEDELEVDEEGTRDSGYGSSWFITDGEISPGDLEVYDGDAWVPVTSINESDMIDKAQEAAEIEEEEDYETGEYINIVWPDYNVFNPA